MKQNQKTNGWKRLWLRPLPLPVMWEHFMIVWKMRLRAFLCKDAKEWEDALRKVIEDSEYRKKIVENAYLKCKENYTTFRTGLRLAKLYEEEKSTNYVFVLPGLEISGGIKVALRHAAMLQKKGNKYPYSH